MKIVIDNPCHENWNNMATNEKGAFCLSCRKNVIDFSKNTVEEIKNFFIELPQTQTVCGRFKEEQLNEISFGHFFIQFRRWKYFQKAAVIVFFIFGFSLFGTAQHPVHKRPLIMKGEVSIVTPPDTTKAKMQSGKDSIKTDHHHIMGGPKYIQDDERKPKKPLPEKTPFIRGNRNN